MHLKLVLIVACCCIGADLAKAEERYIAVDTDDLHSYWIPQKSASVGHLFPRSAMRKHMDVCVAVAFTVEADGTAHNVQVIRTETSKPDDSGEMQNIATSAADSVARMHYDAAPANQMRQPIFTYVAVSMAVASSGTTAAIVKRHAEDVAKSCRVQDFVAYANDHKIIPAK